MLLLADRRRSFAASVPTNQNKSEKAGDESQRLQGPKTDYRAE
jgi:hypothetical protein